MGPLRSTFLVSIILALGFVAAGLVFATDHYAMLRPSIQRLEIEQTADSPTVHGLFETSRSLDGGSFVPQVKRCPGTPKCSIGSIHPQGCYNNKTPSTYVCGSCQASDCIESSGGCCVVCTQSAPPQCTVCQATGYCKT
jgi:hypothetical protein